MRSEAALSDNEDRERENEDKRERERDVRFTSRVEEQYLQRLMKLNRSCSLRESVISFTHAPQ